MQPNQNAHQPVGHGQSIQIINSNAHVANTDQPWIRQRANAPAQLRPKPTVHQPGANGIVTKHIHNAHADAHLINNWMVANANGQYPLLTPVKNAAANLTTKQTQHHAHFIAKCGIK